MPKYRAYIVGHDGHFIGYEPMVCANDNEATVHAKRLSSRGPVEVWSGSHLLVRLAAAETGDYAINTAGRMVPKPQSIRSKAAPAGDSSRDIVPAK
jgi:hypothetical protein